MATQVDVGTALTVLTNIGEPRNETTLRHAFVGSFSDAKNDDRADEGDKYRNRGVSLSIMPLATSRPRLTPRPFSREKSWETFAAVKPPVATLKYEDAAAVAVAKVSIVPPLLDQKLIENKSSKDFAASIPFYPNLPSNTIILFETVSSEKSKAQVNPDKTFTVCSARQDYVSSLSADLRTPRNKSLERKDTFSGSPNIRKRATSTAQTKPRPESAIFLELLKDQRTSITDIPEEAKPEKPCGRKPRPLSMDLTAKFENLSAQRMSRQSERNKMLGLGLSDYSKPNLAVADESKAATPIQESAPGDGLERKNLWRKNHDEDLAEILDKSKPPSSVLNCNESHFGVKNPTNHTEVENESSKGVRKTADTPDPAANASSAVDAGPLPGSSAKETRVMNIQQRIKELTGDNADFKHGNLRQSFRSRPLSSDLTKMFSGSLAPEKPLGVTRKLPGESQDVGEKERTLHCGRETRNPWKPQPVTKTPFTDERPNKDVRSAKGKQSALVVQGDGPALAATHSVKIPENAVIKTVRATMFEHNVERHTLAANHFVPRPTNDPSAGQAGCFMESLVEKVPDAKVTSKKVPDVTMDAKRVRKTRLVSKDKSVQSTARECNKTPPEPVEDSFIYQRIEPRYEILQTIGERVQSEAITTAPEDKAVMLRSRRSLKEIRTTDSGSFADAIWVHSLDIQGWKDFGESAVKSTPTRDPKGSPHERVTNEAVRSWSGQYPATAIASYFANRSKNWEQAEEKVSTLMAETDIDRRDTALIEKAKGGSRMVKCFLEGFRVDSGVIEVCESRRSATDEREIQPNLRKMSQRRPRTSSQDESRISTAQEGLDVPGGRLKRDRFCETDVDEGVRKSALGDSPPKPVERWRRKTLPHDAFRMEEAQERAKSPNMRDSFQLWDRSAVKRSAKPSPDGSPKNELSPSDVKATYFALTYQIPDGNENASRKPSDPLKTKYVSPKVCNTPLPPSATFPKTHLPGNRFSDNQGSLDKDLGYKDPSKIPQSAPFKYPLTDVKNENQNWDKETAADLHFPTHSSGAMSPLCLRTLPQDRENLAQKNSNDLNRGVSKDKTADGYRLRVLDLDALMAEYKEDSKKESLVPEERNMFSREKATQRHQSADKRPCGYGERRSDISPGTADKKDISKSFDKVLVKATDGKGSPPRRWGNKMANKQADEASARKKTFIVDEEDGADLVRRHQTAKSTNYSADIGVPISTDVNLSAPFNRSVEGAILKDIRFKREVSVRMEADLHVDVDLNGFGNSRDASAANSEPDPCAVGSGFVNAPPDLRRSYSENVRQSRVRSGGFAFGQKIKDHRNVLHETADDHLSQWSATSCGVFISDGEKDQLKQCFGQSAEGTKDTETLVQGESDNQYGTWQDQQGNAESFAPESPSLESVSVVVRKPTSMSSSLLSLTSAADAHDTSRDPDCASASAEPTELSTPSGTTPDFSFLDQTPILDSSAMKTRVQLSKRRRQHRTPISNSLRRSSGGQDEGQTWTSKSGEPNSAWMVKDSAREKLSEGKGGSQNTERSAAPQTQQLPVFPGMDHSAFKAQLRKRHEPDATTGMGSAVSAQSSSQSPKSQFHSHGLQIPPTAAIEKEGRSVEASPKWLKELKSKKRQSHYENQL